MTDLVSVASNAVQSYQRALGTVSNNIANVSTEGYSRQEVVMVANPVAKVGTVYLGTGVTVDTVKRQYDTFVESNLRNSNSDLSSQEPMVNYANRVIDIMGSTSMGLSGALDQFFNGARDLSSDPASTVMRGSFLRDAENLAARFGELSGQLDLVQSETDEAVKGYVNSMNTIFKQLAQVNTQLTKQKSASLQPADLLDQRDVLLKDLSSYAHIKTFFSENGSVSVSLGPSMSRDVVVDGVNSFMLGTNFNSAAPEKVSLVLNPYGEATPLTGLSGGKLAGIMSFREQVLGSSRSSLDTLANNFVKEVNAIHTAGIDAYGNTGTDLFTIDKSSVGSAGTVKVNFSDALKVSAAAQFRVIEAPNNTGSADASLLYVGDPTTGPADLTSTIANNASASAAITVKATASKPVVAVATIQNGLQDIGIFMGEADAGQQLQVFTRDGRQLAGTAIDTALQGMVLTEANGFATNASYSDAYLNLNGSNSYKDIAVFYGARATVGTQLQADPLETDVTKHTTVAETRVAASLTSDRIQTGLSSIAAGLFTLNGTTLGSFTPASGTLQATDIAFTISTAGISGVTATAKNEISIPVSQIKLDLPLSLKSGTSGGYTVIKAVPTGLTSVQDLVNAINSKSGSTAVRAYIGDSGSLILTNTAGNEGKDIAIDSSASPNALGLAAGNYGGKVSITRALVDGTDTPVELGFAKGTPADLAKMGFKTGTYISGTPSEDLLVFVTGAGEAKISASYAGTPVSAKQAMRSQALQVRFDTATHFTIVDVSTDTVVASRNFDPNILEPAFNYQGIQVSLSSAPKAGDVFTIDGNKDGTGNNENMLQLIDLESEPVMGGGKTFAASYIDNVNDMGNIARQATIAQSALQVVYDQAVTARDQVSGVSLDEEAADLVRYQQAYQAAAKILQVASQLFDSVLQVR
ncbi:MAG: Flagellar hook-associated protein 1 [Pseudomonadota bacterium]|jgi:flagellar hook-associated protein FlgK